MGLKKTSKYTGRQLFDKKKVVFNDAEDAIDEYK